MPRRPRTDAPGAVHHVVIRGIERRAIFLDDDDRRDLAHRLASLLPDAGAACFAWAFLDNHVHLAIQTGSVPISLLMKRLNTGYAQQFNRRHERQGYVFQNRFWSRLVGSDDDLRGLVRYVLLNPKNAGLVGNLRELERHPWSGLGALTGCRLAWPFESVGRTLSLFGETRAVALRALREWLTAEPDSGAAPASGDFGPFLGRGDGEVPAAEGPPRGEAVPARSAEDLVDEVCSEMGVDPLALRRGSRVRDVCDARAAVAWLAVFREGIPGARVAETLRISRQALSKALPRGKRVLDHHRGAPPGGES